MFPFNKKIDCVVTVFLICVTQHITCHNTVSVNDVCVCACMSMKAAKQHSNNKVSSKETIGNAIITFINKSLTNIM